MIGRDPGGAADVVHEYLVLAGLTVQRDGAATWRSSLDTWGEELPLWVRASQHWVQFAVEPFLEAPPGGVAEGLRAELLSLNRELRHAKFGLSEAGAIVLTAELPTEFVELAEVMTILGTLTHCVEEHRARLRMLGSRP